MKKIFLIIGLVIIFVLSGCSSSKVSLEETQNTDPVYEDYLSYTGVKDEINNLTPEQLAKLMIEHTDEDIYLDIRNKAMTFSQEEYDRYYALLLESNIQDMIQEGVIDAEQIQEEKEASDQQRQELDQKAMEKYGKPMYQLPFMQALEL